MALESKEPQNTGTIDKVNCYSCRSKGIYGIVLSPLEVYSCENHYNDLMEQFIRNKRFSNTNLHRVVDSYEDSKTHTRKKITHGKAWEIANRTIAEDGKTVINAVTGKNAEY